jgi:hypothetical protein
MGFKDGAVLSRFCDAWVRKQREIDEERFVLKALRGNFDHVHDEQVAGKSDAQQAIMAARR